ncbi:MAG: TetR/AcrR family transcriptional regulator [Clostridia bacterium]|nr:TetR/AcrR family transcriptional regulator [Clostridia bacterium]
MEKEIRQPIQQRSIDKKERIIKAAYELFSSEGYHGTITSDIAKKAGVSTGIVYGYFKDKRDILFYVIKIYIKEVATPVMDYISSLTPPVSLEEIVRNVIDLTEDAHNTNAFLHNTLHSLAYTDGDINEAFLHLENHITISASKTLRELGIDTKNLEEKVHIAMNIIQSYAHESIYDKHDYIDYKAMKENIVKTLVFLFE